MKQILSVLLLGTLALSSSFAQESDSLQISSEQIDSILQVLTKELNYQHGTIALGEDLAEIQVPEGFKFLDKEQSTYVLTELWGNPEDESTLGMLLPEDETPLSENFTYAIEISFAEEGYVDDKDAKKLKYDKLLKDMKSDTKEANEMRKQMGYPTVELVGWASPPFYDSENKKLHWAKELKFEGEEANTLNYNIRILGRKGYLMLNAIGDIDVLPLVQQDVDKVLASVNFKKGNTYRDFDPSIDQVAAYGIGGLVAGKILAKTGFFVLLAKFWKVIAVAVVGGFAALRRFLFGGKKEEENTEQPAA